MKEIASTINRIQQKVTHLLRAIDKPIYVIGQRVKVPTDIHPSKQGTVTGYEKASDNHHLKIKSQTYIYYITFGEGGQAWIVSEEELEKWQSV